MKVPQIQQQAAHEKLAQGEAVFVDIRDPGSFAEAHIPGAIHLTDQTVQDFVDRTDRAKTVIVYCYHGNSSIGGAGFFLEKGFQDVYSLIGGFEAWRVTYPGDTQS